MGTYFEPTVLAFTKCSGSKHRLSHRSITPVPKGQVFELYSRECQKYHGDIVSFLYDRLQPRRIGPKIKSCKHKSDTTSPCSGSGEQYELIMTMPVMLIFETMEDFSPPAQWSYRHTIEVPGENEKGERKVAHYDIVARVIFTSGHFTAYVRHGINHCYYYNDMEKGGTLSQREQSHALDVFIAGKTIAEPRNFTTSVVYHLREGLKGQAWISRRLRKRAEEWNVSIVDVNGIDLPRVTLTGPGEVLVKRAQRPGEFDDYETLIQLDPPLPSSFDDKTASTKRTQHTGKHASRIDNQSQRVGKQWPFPSVEPSDKDTEIVSARSGAENADADSDAQVGRQRTKRGQRQSLASSSDVSMAKANKFRCRCGFEGEVWDWHLDEDIIQCDSAEFEGECSWSHSACQLDGWTYNLKPEDPFYCPLCEPLDWDIKTGYVMKLPIANAHTEMSPKVDVGQAATSAIEVTTKD